MDCSPALHGVWSCSARAATILGVVCLPLPKQSKGDGCVSSGIVTSTGFDVSKATCKTSFYKGSTAITHVAREEKCFPLLHLYGVLVALRETAHATFRWS
jgi:hypothetical protein